MAVKYSTTKGAVFATDEYMYSVEEDGYKEVTVFMPADCGSCCDFCTTKQWYKNINVVKFFNTMENIRNSNIDIVVISGGEVMKDLDMLDKLLNLFDGTDKKIYINTSYYNTLAKSFIEILDKHPNVLGVNISRHIPAKVEMLEELSKNRGIRINIVNSPITADKHIKYWKNYYKYLDCIVFREDYKITTPASLYVADDEIITYLSDNLEYKSISYCRVCCNYVFEDKSGLKVRYHKGLMNTSLKIGNTIEVKELVVTPDGEVYTDWDLSKAGLEKLAKDINLKL